MADFTIAYNWMMDNEDAGRKYATVPDPTRDDPNAQACSGINSHSWPEDFAFINSLPQADRATAVQAFYYKNFWNHWYAQLTSDDVAKRVFDMAVNAGQRAAVKLLQQAVNWCGDPATPMLAVDGEWGPLTVAQTNACGPALVTAFQQARVAHYQQHDTNNKALPQQIARAKK